MATKRTKSWFFEITRTALKRGTRFRNGDRPNQSTLEDAFKSAIFSSEINDRAKEDTGSSASELAGHVVVSSDEQTKNRQPRKQDRTLAVQPHQMPSVTATETTSLTFQGATYNGVPLEVTEDNVTNVYKTFKIKIAIGFRDILQVAFNAIDNLVSAVEGLQTQLANLTGRVNSNTQAISTLSSGTFTQQFPLGGVLAWMSDSPPNSFALANGQFLDQTQYANLFSIIGYKYSDPSNPPGSNEFALPKWNNKGQMLRGVGSGLNIGKEGGNETITLNSNQIPKHIHSSGSLQAVSSGSAHKHEETSFTIRSVNGPSFVYQASNQTVAPFNSTSGEHSHSISGNTGQNSSTESAIDIMNPYSNIMWIIKIEA